ncbi:MAG: NAD-dependent epimerase/dehydratase family protein [Culturomica sp.]|jgi:UDP-glucuronate 4-epimerase|nr:NAD-dependent epimerase/dehydratase family protein [Culturomica sp.]
MKILLTGVAGFIGSFMVKRLCDEGHDVYGIDSVNEYYDVDLKHDRLKSIGIADYKSNIPTDSSIYKSYTFHQLNICSKEALDHVFRNNNFDMVVHLAAQAGVRYSLINPETYIDTNINGFFNILEACRQYKCNNLIYASSSSVYGNRNEMPFKETDITDYPVSLYAATKKSNELMAYSYSKLYGIRTVGLRFFTVYGPYGRPDMAYWIFADAILGGKTIKVFNNGNMFRDFTYIDDITSGILKIVNSIESSHSADSVPAVTYNIGRGEPVNLMEFIHLLEINFDKEVKKEYLGMQAGDVYKTWADTSKLYADYGYLPSTPLEEGIHSFAEWFKEYYNLKNKKTSV